MQDRSVSGETLFVEPMWAVELNNRLMMLEREAEAEERRMLAAADGDGARLRARACGSRSTRWSRSTRSTRARSSPSAMDAIEPEIADGALELLDARHPLLIAERARGGADRCEHPRRTARNRDLGPQHRRQDRRAQDDRPVRADGAGRDADSGASRQPHDGVSQRVSPISATNNRSRPTCRASPRTS